ncbi:MAG: DUF5132 domain-containing protein [Chloroflexota bacterium]
MEIFAFVLGAGAALVAGSPMNPGLRPVAKALVAGALVASDLVRTAAATAGEQWQDLVAEVKSDREDHSRAEAAAPVAADPADLDGAARPTE